MISKIQECNTGGQVIKTDFAKKEYKYLLKSARKVLEDMPDEDKNYIGESFSQIIEILEKKVVKQKTKGGLRYSLTWDSEDAQTAISCMIQMIDLMMLIYSNIGQFEKMHQELQEYTKELQDEYIKLLKEQNELLTDSIRIYRENNSFRNLLNTLLKSFSRKTE